MANDENATFWHSINPNHSSYSPSLVLQEWEESPSQYIKNINIQLFLDPVMSNRKTICLLKGVCLVYFKLNFSKKKLTWKCSTSETYCT